MPKFFDKLEYLLYSNKQSKGLALILVTFIVALASILVINLTYSTYLGSRISVTAERSVQAEYLLKSALNYAMVLIKEDLSPEDSIKDVWGKYAQGIPLQRDDLLPDTLPNIPLWLEIRPEGSKLNIRELAPRSINQLPSIKIRDLLARLFANSAVSVGYEFDGELYYDGSGKAYQFTSKELIGNLIDYVDQDDLPYDQDGFRGIENQNSNFPNSEITRLAELAAVPGFTAARVKRLLPYLTTVDNRRININLAPRVLITSLDDGIDEALADRIIAYREGEEGPIRNPADLQNLIPQAVFDNINSLISFDSGRFQVISKVEYSTSVFFLRADLADNGRKQLPGIKSLELY